jgi:hypothetical protein
MHRRSLPGRVYGVLTAAALAVSLVACADTTHIPPAPTETEGAAPLFASDEEALAAAVEAYEAYASVVDEILARRGTPDELSLFTGDQLVRTTMNDVDEFLNLGWTATAPREVLNPTLQSRVPEDESAELIIIYVCEDLAKVDVVDGAGVSVVEERRNPRTGIEAAVLFDANKDAKVVDRRVWSGSGVCG